MKPTREAAKEAERDELEAEGSPDEGGAHRGGRCGDGSWRRGRTQERTPQGRGGIPGLGYGSFSGNRRQQGGDFQCLRLQASAAGVGGGGRAPGPSLVGEPRAQVKCGMRKEAAGVAQRPQHRQPA